MWPKIRCVATIWLIFKLGALSGLALEPRKSPDEYPHACKAEGGKIGVEFLSRSLPTPQGTVILPNVLIFEIGVFPEPGASFRLDSSNFVLTWKGQKNASFPVDPEYVVASLNHPEWGYSRRPRLVMDAGTVNRDGRDHRGVVFGGPPRNPRYPGDTRQGRTAPPPQGPTASRAPESSSHPDQLPQRVVVLHALPRETLSKPAAGYVYFDYDGKLKKLKALNIKLRLPTESCEFQVRR